MFCIVLITTNLYYTIVCSLLRCKAGVFQLYRWRASVRYRSVSAHCQDLAPPAVEARKCKTAKRRIRPDSRSTSAGFSVPSQQPFVDAVLRRERTRLNEIHVTIAILLPNVHVASKPSPDAAFTPRRTV